MRKDPIDLIHRTIQSKYALGVYRGRVEYNQDPMGLGRVKIRIPYFHGEYNETPLDKLRWAWPAFPIKSYQVPEVGDYVWVIFEGGDKDYPVYFGQWYPIHLTEQIYGKAKGRKDLDNKEDEWYPRKDSRLFTLPDGYSKLGPTSPPESSLAIDLDSPRERVINRSLKGASIFVSDQDNFESLQILDRTGQGLRMTSPDADLPLEEFRQLETAFEATRVGPGKGKVKLELKGQPKTKLTFELTPEGKVAKLGFNALQIQVDETNTIYNVTVGKVSLNINSLTGSVEIIADQVNVACNEFNVAADSTNIMGDLKVAGSISRAGPLKGVK